jgi:beta-phosphoglucomutase-like phosphatase (HAD superfamily)
MILLTEIKGVLFDFDGILADTEYYQWQGWVVPLKKRGINLTKEQYLKYVGKRGDQVEKEIREDLNLNVKKGILLEQKIALLDEWFKELKPFPFRFPRNNRLFQTLRISVFYLFFR